MAALRITIDRASGGYRVHVWAAAGNELLFWSDIYGSREGAQRAARELQAHAGSAPVEDLTGPDADA